MSYFAWLDYSEHDRRVALDVIDKFREHETRDELGLAAIRDGLADLFFPGTSTIQTRARYFLFVPWMYLDQEWRRASSAEVKNRARKAEIALIDVLADSDDASGTIGVLARAGLKWLPSNIYWQGLGRLGIRTFPGSQDQYHRSLDAFYRGGAGTLSSDDKELVGRGRARNWSASLPDAPEDFPAKASLTLLPEEGEFLRERITLAAPDSLFRYFVEWDDAVDPLDYPWDHPAVETLAERLREQLEHARNLSEVMHGAAILYNLMLARLRKSAELTGEYEEMLDDWCALMRERRAAHLAWDRERFWAIVRATGANVTHTTRLFVNQWIDLALALDGQNPGASEKARSLIEQRERQLKRGQARLAGGRALDLWQGRSGTSRLNYRWYVTQSHLHDLRDTRVKAVAHA